MAIELNRVDVDTLKELNGAIKEIRMRYKGTQTGIELMEIERKITELRHKGTMNPIFKRYSAIERR